MPAASDACQLGVHHGSSYRCILWRDLSQARRLDEELQFLKITIRKKARRAEPEVRSQLEKVTKRIACNQSKVAAARVQVEQWVTDKAKDDLRFRNEKIPEDRNRNPRRAAEADRYAAACIDLAIAAVDEAERAALEAWLVREEANSSRCEPQKREAMAPRLSCHEL
jgi:hypothetical protein